MGLALNGRLLVFAGLYPEDTLTQGGLEDIAVSHQWPESGQQCWLGSFWLVETAVCIFTSIYSFLSSPPFFLPLQ